MRYGTNPATPRVRIARRLASGIASAASCVLWNRIRQLSVANAIDNGQERAAVDGRRQVVALALLQVGGHEVGRERKEPDEQQEQQVHHQDLVIDRSRRIIAWWLIQMIPIVRNETAYAT